MGLGETFASAKQVGKRYAAPTLRWPECPPVGTVLAPTETNAGERPTVFVVGREDADGRYLDESGGTINQPWPQVLEKWGQLEIIGHAPMPPREMPSDAAREYPG